MVVERPASFAAQGRFSQTQTSSSHRSRPQQRVVNKQHAQRGRAIGTRPRVSGCGGVAARRTAGLVLCARPCATIKIVVLTQRRRAGSW
jgi:hypothetical protein